MTGTPVSVDSVISNEALESRRSRAADGEAERRGLQRLADELAGTPRRVLQRLADVALELCRAHSAGVSLAEEDAGRRVFRWHAVAGAWSKYLWSTLPRDLSPCGTVLDRKSPLFMVEPVRYFSPLEQVSPQVKEVILIPFSVRGAIVGTVWVVSHDDTREFDREDRRVVAKLAQFAALAYERLTALGAEDVYQLARLSKQRAAPSGAPPRSIQRRVLVVDDNAEAASMLAAVLGTMGHVVKTAHDGETAVQIARAFGPNVVLMDVSMPGMSGLEAARQMRQFLDPAARILAVTGHSGDVDREESRAAGFDQHLVKPVDPAFLRSLIG